MCPLYTEYPPLREVSLYYYYYSFSHQVNISTIAGSRHVGPIKPKVDDWEKQLALFSETMVIESVNSDTVISLMVLLPSL